MWRSFNSQFQWNSLLKRKDDARYDKAHSCSIQGSCSPCIGTSIVNTNANVEHNVG